MTSPASRRINPLNSPITHITHPISPISPISHNITHITHITHITNIISFYPHKPTQLTHTCNASPAQAWDLLSDLRIGTVKGPYGARVHKGFHNVLTTIDRGGAFLDEIRAAVTAHSAKRVVRDQGYQGPGAPLVEAPHPHHITFRPSRPCIACQLQNKVFTGYSLGGAVASLALLQHGDALLSAGVDVRCITFGCPRLADNNDLPKLPRRLTTKIVHTYIEGDPIPLSLTSLVPWHRVNYVHVGNAVVIENKGSGINVQEEGRRQTADSTIKWYAVVCSVQCEVCMCVASNDPSSLFGRNLTSFSPSNSPPLCLLSTIYYLLSTIYYLLHVTGGASRRRHGPTTSQSPTNATSSCSQSSSTSN